MGELGAALQVVQLVVILHAVGLAVQHLQLVQKPHVKELCHVVEAQVEFFQLLESLDALQFLELAAGQMQDSYLLKRGAHVSERAYHRVTELQLLQTGQNLAGDLQVVQPGVHSELDLLERLQLIRVYLEH